MKIGLLCAGDRELAPFIPKIRECKTTERAMLRFHEGYIAGVRVATLFSGVCKVNAAIAAQLLIDAYECGAIINAGTAGGMVRDLDILDTVVSDEIVSHDVADGILTAFHPRLESGCFRADSALLKLAEKAIRHTHTKHRIVFGRMATGEQFIEDDRRDLINAKYAPLSVDMESAGVAHVCYVNHIPFIAVRTITDTPDHRGQAVFDVNCTGASQVSADFVETMLRLSGWSDSDRP